MFKRVSLFGLIVLLLLRGVSAYAEVEPNCEMGDAVFRNKVPEAILGVGFHHAGIYFCSHSKGDEVYVETAPPYYINITNSDLKHSVIEAVGEHGTVSCQPFIDSYVNFPGGYKGAYNSGDMDAEKRRKIIATAWMQKGAKYVKDRWPGIKNPTGFPKTFRCDGLVEYCYEQVMGGFFTNEEEKRCWSSLLDKEYSEDAWPTFYPKALMKRMKLAGGKRIGNPPQVTSFKLYRQDGTEIKPDDWIMGTVIVEAVVTDEDDGSGIDKVEVSYKIRLLEETGTIGTTEEDKDVSGTYTYTWDVPIATVGNNLYELSVLAYDRASNHTLPDSSKFTYGSPYKVEAAFPVIVDNGSPTVKATYPTDGKTNVSVGARIHIIFSEDMDKDTINSTTITGILGTVTYDEITRRAIITPEGRLAWATNYTVHVLGGENGKG
ncbi:MAG: Ig-like domain-containing protein [bacterium]